MLCKIADLFVDVPEIGDMASRCEPYRCEAISQRDILIDPALFKADALKDLPEAGRYYMLTGSQFHRKLLQHNGLMLHASAVEFRGKAYLFSGPCGTGKSTHTRLWQSVFGPTARVFNDDKPALRCIDGIWFAYGTPWCGKDGININMKAPLAGICFLKQASDNHIRCLSGSEAAQKIIGQTLRRFKEQENLELMLFHVNDLVQKIPVFELENRPEPAAAIMSYEAMSASGL